MFFSCNGPRFADCLILGGLGLGGRRLEGRGASGSSAADFGCAKAASAYHISIDLTVTQNGRNHLPGIEIGR